MSIHIRVAGERASVSGIGRLASLTPIPTVFFDPLGVLGDPVAKKVEIAKRTQFAAPKSDVGGFDGPVHRKIRDNWR